MKGVEGVESEDEAKARGFIYIYIYIYISREHDVKRRRGIEENGDKRKKAER